MNVKCILCELSAICMHFVRRRTNSKRYFCIFHVYCAVCVFIIIIKYQRESYTYYNNIHNIKGFICAFILSSSIRLPVGILSHSSCGPTSACVLSCYIQNGLVTSLKSYPLIKEYPSPSLSHQLFD